MAYKYYMYLDQKFNVKASFQGLFFSWETQENFEFWNSGKHLQHYSMWHPMIQSPDAGQFI